MIGGLGCFSVICIYYLQLSIIYPSVIFSQIYYLSNLCVFDIQTSYFLSYKFYYKSPKLNC